MDALQLVWRQAQTGDAEGAWVVNILRGEPENAQAVDGRAHR